MNISQLQLYAYYNFNTLVPTILGGARKNVMLQAIVGYDMAVKYCNVDLMSRTISPSLPVGTPKDPRKYTYLILKNDAGATEIMAFEWIDNASIVVATTVKAIVTIPAVNASDIAKIRDNLILMGFHDFQIDTQ